jgi:hypothetical protein
MKKRQTMHYAIQVESVDTDYLQSTARKRSFKHFFLVVEQGMVLLKLGKSEYAVKPGQAIWIPFQCLHALTMFPQTQLTRIEFSARLTHTFPKQAGYIELGTLCQALLDRVKTCDRQSTVYPHLLGVLTDEVLHFQPTLTENHFSQLLQKWQAQCPTPIEGISPEMHLALLLREAEKKSQSGARAEQIASQYFDGNLAHYLQLRQNLLGHR